MVVEAEMKKHMVNVQEVWRFSIVPHGPICIRVPLHSLLALLFFLWRLHLI